MPHYVGLDVSKATTSICVIDEAGEIIDERVVETEPTVIASALRGHRRRYRKVGMETLSFSPWLYEGLSKAGLPVICIHANHAHSVLKARLNKTDRNDAQGIAELMRVGAYKAVYMKTKQSQEWKLLLAARRLLLMKCSDLDGMIRDALLQLGLKLRRGSIATFASRLGEVSSGDSPMRAVIEALFAARSALFSQVESLTAEVRALAVSDPICRRLMTAPGVGPVTAVAYRAAIDVPQRFAASRDVGVSLGLTPRAFNSGTVERKGRISRRGDHTTRSLLFMAAQSVLRARSRDCQLKRWGSQIAARRGARKAIVAVARRLSVILHRMWLDGADFRAETPSA